MRDLAILLGLGLAASAVVPAQSLPGELSGLAARAGIQSPVAGWCRAEFRAGESGAYAVALASPDGGGRYVVLRPDAAVLELASFSGKADLSCYTSEEAKGLDATITRSAAIHGRVAPRWTSTVVCGFVDATAAVCWQYSPADSRFVEVGRWIT
jgi:hypothetical protein